jgi:hypothetical protein
MNSFRYVYFLLSALLLTAGVTFANGDDQKNSGNEPEMIELEKRCGGCGGHDGGYEGADASGH